MRKYDIKYKDLQKLPYETSLFIYIAMEIYNRIKDEKIVVNTTDVFYNGKIRLYKSDFIALSLYLSYWIVKKDFVHCEKVVQVLNIGEISNVFEGTMEIDEYSKTYAHFKKVIDRMYIVTNDDYEDIYVKDFTLSYLDQFINDDKGYILGSDIGSIIRGKIYNTTDKKDGKKVIPIEAGQKIRDREKGNRFKY